MKQLVAVRSNAYFAENDQKKGFSLEAQLELVIIFTDGKDYKWKKVEGIVSENKLTETRLIVSAETLTELITELQLHQKKLHGCRENADKINALIKHVSDLPDVSKSNPPEDGKTF
jgi:hypothetical protein